MPVKYDPSRGCLATTLTVANTAIPSVLSRYEFWLLFNLHLAIGCAFRFGYLPHDDETPFGFIWNDMKVVTAITTFFEVFYTNQCHSRYLEFYEATRMMLGTLYDYCFELRLHLQDEGKQHARLASRQVVAAILLFFYEMGGVSEPEWGELEAQGLVKSSEREFLEKFSSQQHSLIMLQWSAEAALGGCAECKVPANVVKSLVGRLLTCRGLQQEVVDCIRLPMPFQYFHLLKAMLLVNLVGWAYGMAITKSVFAPVVYWVCLLIFMGMMELASQLADPFGDDDVDFPVTDWLDEFVENTVVLMEFRSPPDYLQRTLENEKALRLTPSGLKLFLDGRPRSSKEPDSSPSGELCESSEAETQEDMLKPLMYQ